MNLTEAMGWTLVHFLWQGAAIGILVAAVLGVMRNARPGSRYIVNGAALLLMLGSGVGTFLLLRSSPAAPWSVRPQTLLPVAVGSGTASSLPGRATNLLPMVVWAWLAGVAGLSIRAVGGWAVAKRFAGHHTQTAAAIWEERFSMLARRLAISRPVRLAVSSLAEVPAVVGWIRPVVLLPASLFTGLTTEQIEAVLAHELAHVRRHDYLINLLQTAAETLLFYHPAVWWVSRNLRQEREHCCDDVAVELCGSRLEYARALTQLELMRRGAPRLAMAVAAGSLRARVQRLLERKPAAVPGGWSAGLTAAAVMVAAMLSADAPWTLRAQSPQPADPRAAEVPVSQNAPSSWLEQMEAEGFHDLNVDHLIAMKIQGVTAAYLRGVRAEGIETDADHLVAYRIHGVTPEYIRELKAAGLRDLTGDRLVALRIHGVEPAAVRELESLGYTSLTADQLVSMRINDVTPEFVREAQRRGFRQPQIDQLIQLKRLGILKAPVIL